jgi:hypothetical protein
VLCYARSEELGGHTDTQVRTLKERRAKANAAAQAKSKEDLDSVKNPSLAKELQDDHTVLFKECNINPPGSDEHSDANPTFLRMRSKAKAETVRLGGITTNRQSFQLTNTCVPLCSMCHVCLFVCVCVLCAVVRITVPEKRVHFVHGSYQRVSLMTHVRFC